MPKLKKKINYSILIKKKKTQQPRTLQLVLRVLPISNPTTKNTNLASKNSNRDQNNTNEKKKRNRDQTQTQTQITNRDQTQMKPRS